MRVILFSSEFPPGPGGLGTHAYYLSKSMSEKGWEIVVLTPQDYASAAEVAEFNRTQAFPVVTLPSGRGAIIELFTRVKVLARQLKSMNPDIVVASGERAAWLAALVCFMTSRRYAVVGHGTEYGTASGWRAFLTRLALNRADLVIVVSNFTHALVKKLGATPRRMTVIPNGADPDLFMRLPPDQVIEFKRKIGMHDRHIILTVGQVTERKGQEVIIRALPQILDSIPDTHYVMVGLPTGKEVLMSLAKSLGVHDHVHFAGKVSQQELVRYMNACDVFAMTSRMTSSGDCEGYGIAAVEAALCGKPAVVSGESGLAEAIVDGETGIVVPPNDVQATSAALIRLLSDRNLRRHMGENAQARALREQTWCRRGAEMESALRGLVEGEHIVAQNLTHTV
ncbi:glycosyltransferase family 4 protein [Sphingobacteriales bacterium CHB3]|nr:glycosyltransferase family 4 protein [Sphingobacteriales bacterium CHB3]